MRRLSAEFTFLYGPDGSGSMANAYDQAHGAEDDFAGLDSTPLPKTADGRTILPSGRIVSPSGEFRSISGDADSVPGAGRPQGALYRNEQGEWVVAAGSAQQLAWLRYTPQKRWMMNSQS